MNASKKMPDKEDLARKMRDNLEQAQEDPLGQEERKLERDRKVKPSKFNPDGPPVAPDGDGG